jgi:hypothetical protein
MGSRKVRHCVKWLETFVVKRVKDVDLMLGPLFEIRFRLRGVVAARRAFLVWALMGSLPWPVLLRLAHALVLVLKLPPFTTKKHFSSTRYFAVPKTVLLSRYMC